MKTEHLQGISSKSPQKLNLPTLAAAASPTDEKYKVREEDMYLHE